MPCIDYTRNRIIATRVEIKKRRIAPDFKGKDGDASLSD